MRKTHILVLAVVAAAIVFAVGAAGAYGTLADDATPPATTTNVTPTYWDDAVITLTATDAEGITYIYHELDGGVVRVSKVEAKPASATVEAPLSFTDATHTTAHHVNPGPGVHTLKYWAQDANGNVEAQHTVTFEILADTAKPTTSAAAATVVKGRTATLKYKVTDAAPTKGSAAVKILVKKGAKVAKTIKVASAAVNTQLSAKFRCTLAKGVYTYYVYATDAAGNVQAKAGSAKLTVK